MDNAKELEPFSFGSNVQIVVTGPMICVIYNLCVVVAKRPLPEEVIPKRCYAGRNLVVLKKNRT